MARRGLARASACGLALLTMAIPALAGDRALLDVIGYSTDGRHFAFEEFGVQDGSGFAYSNIYVVDLPADNWVPGSPFRTQADDSGPELPVAEVRVLALEDAAEQLTKLEIFVPAEPLAVLGDGVPDVDGKSMTYALPTWGPPGSTDASVHRLDLSTFSSDSPNDCQAILSEKALGYALTHQVADGPGTVVHKDGATLPRSRGCPLDYRLYAVFRPFEGNPGQSVAIVSVYPFGFEGPDRRFLAVPLGE